MLIRITKHDLIIKLITQCLVNPSLTFTRDLIRFNTLSRINSKSKNKLCRNLFFNTLD